MNKRFWAITGSVVASLMAALGLVLLVSPRTEAAIYTAIVVDTLEDELNDDGDCSLREAIEAANTNTAIDNCPAGDGVMTDTITFQVAGTITLTDNLLVTAGGPMTVDGGQAITVTTQSEFWVQSGASATLRELTIETTNSIANWGSLAVVSSVFRGRSSGGEVFNSGDMVIISSTLKELHGYQSGGAFSNSGTATIVDSRIVDNVLASGFPLPPGKGGGIYNEGVLDVIGSTISGNLAVFASGGGIFTAGTMTISDSIVSANYAEFAGGGIGQRGGQLSIINSTLSGNSTGAGGGAVHNSGYYGGVLIVTNSTLADNSADGEGGGIGCSSNCQAWLYNTIVSNNLGDDCSGDPVIDGGHNIDSDGTCSLDPANGSLPNTDPLLGPFQDNGGKTWTHALLPGSPAIDAANPAFCPPTDQRGTSRPLDGDGDGLAVCDIGSYEFEFEATHADFVGQPTAGLPPLTVVFTNTSTGDYDTSLWLFGDGFTSTLPSPTHTYPAAGVYTVTLAVDGPGGADTKVKPRYITVQYGIYLPLLLRSD
jgi:CSLREA domain-containing protein